MMCVRKSVVLPCSCLLDESRLHPVADAALQLMMMMTDNRLLLEVLHRRTAHVQRLLESKHLQSRCRQRAARNLRSLSTWYSVGGQVTGGTLQQRPGGPSGLASVARRRRSMNGGQLAKTVSNRVAVSIARRIFRPITPRLLNLFDVTHAVEVRLYSVTHDPQ